jgi:hypothetical protein
VIYVDLVKLRRQQNFELENLLRESNIPSEFHEAIIEFHEFILWIWDGFTDPEEPGTTGGDSAETPEFRNFLAAIGGGSLEWAPNCIVSSRREKQSVIQDAVIFNPKPWTLVEVCLKGNWRRRGEEGEEGRGGSEGEGRRGMWERRGEQRGEDEGS